MYEIVAYLNRKADLDDFLNATHRFGKKFYRCKEGGGHLILDDGSKLPILHVMALAISRDLTYRLHWTIPYDDHTDRAEYQAKETALEEQAFLGKRPLRNANPHEDRDRDLFYPYLKIEESERPWENVFASFGFISSHTIVKDGHILF